MSTSSDSGPPSYCSSPPSEGSSPRTSSADERLLAQPTLLDAFSAHRNRLLDDEEYTLGSDYESGAESSSRLLHFGEHDTFSRLSSRAASPIPSGGVVIHHHYHHSPRLQDAYSVPSDYSHKHSYRSGRLAKKLGTQIDNHRRSPWKRRNGVIALADPTKSRWLPASKTIQRFLRHPLVPTQPISLFFAAVLFATFALTVTSFMYHILSNDKVPLPWRDYCSEQAAFPHDLADSLAPVNVFVGVFSIDAAYERRHLIRSTYARHSRPIDPATGAAANNVQLKFILGRPRKHHARRIALEMETYNDIVVLDVLENMNKGKTHAYFTWANENATIPFYYKSHNGLHAGFKKADYVVKADDDSFVVLSELERHLRVTPREKTYWGYLIRNLFMGGEIYALSSDLVNYIATNPALLPYTTGAEDKRVAKWMRLHPEASKINWVTERCWVYDHPKASTTYAHGFLFPQEVERVKAESTRGIPRAEIARRGGQFASSYSTVTTWKKLYEKPKKGMTIEEEVEALVEGGGRWGTAGWTKDLPTDQLARWDQIVFDVRDKRLREEKGAQYTHLDQSPYPDPHAAFEPTLRYKYPKDLYRDPGDAIITPHKKRSLVWENSWNADEDQSDKVALPGAEEEDTLKRISRFRFASKERYAQLPPLASEQTKARLIPRPTLRYESESWSLREQRMLGRQNGGTVAVHFLKRNEWFLETALALLGRDQTWDSGIDALAFSPSSISAAGLKDERFTVASGRQWNGFGTVESVESKWGGARMYGSPIVRENGYIQLGRQLPIAQEEDLKSQPRLGRLRGTPRKGYADVDENPASKNTHYSNSSSLLPESSTASEQAPVSSKIPDTGFRIQKPGGAQ